MPPPLAGRVALVTGASRGIGYATAVALAEAGAHIVAIARTVGGLEELDDAVKALGGSTTLVPLDLRDSAGIDRLGLALHQRFGRLDVLVGNAAMLVTLLPLGHVEAITSPSSGVKPIDVSIELPPAMAQAEAPLPRWSVMIFVSSGITAQSPAYWGPYSVSKTALEALARTYAAECASTNVRVNILAPGPVRTRMRAQAMPGEDPTTVDPPDKVASHVVGLCLPSMRENGKLYSYPHRRYLDFRAPS